MEHPPYLPEQKPLTEVFDIARNNLKGSLEALVDIPWSSGRRQDWLFQTRIQLHSALISFNHSCLSPENPCE